MDRLPVAIVSVYPYVNAVVAVALGWLFYREPFGLRETARCWLSSPVAVVKRYSQSPESPRLRAPVRLSEMMIRALHSDADCWHGPSGRLCSPGRRMPLHRTSNIKSSAEWSSEEVHQLLTKSPWAKQVTAMLGARAPLAMAVWALECPEFCRAKSGTEADPAMSAGLSPRTGQGGWRRPAAEGEERRRRSIGAGPDVQGLVRWESAQPVLEAAKAALPDALSPTAT